MTALLHFSVQDFQCLKLETILLLIHICGIIIIATWTRPNLCPSYAENVLIVYTV